MINRSLMFKPDSNRSCSERKESRPVRTLIDPSLDNIEYGIKLSKLLKEFGMYQKELAVSIGISAKTVERYLNGENAKSIKEDIKAKINLALNEVMYYKGYEHMPAKERAEYLNEVRKMLVAYPEFSV